MLLCSQFGNYTTNKNFVLKLNLYSENKFCQNYTSINDDISLKLFDVYLIIGFLRTDCAMMRKKHPGNMTEAEISGILIDMDTA